GMGGLQDIPQAAVVAPLCRRAEAVWERTHVLPRLDAVWAAALGAAGGDGDGPAGPAYIDFPTDLLRETLHEPEYDRSWLAPRAPQPVLPDPAAEEAAAEVLRAARRPVVVSGRGARRAGPALERFLAETGALHLDTAESRGALAEGHPASVPAVRGRVMAEADTVVTLERRLDFQLAYGSRAVFTAGGTPAPPGTAGATPAPPGAENARFVRIGLPREERADNRR